jgi:hypothetical protein
MIACSKRVYNSSLMLMGAAPLALDTQIMPYFVSICLSQCSVSESESHYNLFGNGGRYDIKLKMEYLSDPYGAVILCGANNACRWVNYLSLEYKM